MHRSTMISLALGGTLGVVACAFIFVAFSIVQPGWLQLAVAPERGQTHAPNPDAVVATYPTPVINVSRLPPLGGTATPAPLPTTSGLCGGPAQFTIALLGVDNRQSDYTEAARTDAISLVNVNFNQASAALLAIPRDVYVALPNLEEVGITQDRINTAYVFGEVYGVEGGGPAEVKATIELNFGVRVDRYMLVNFAAFEAAVDTLGGIDVYVVKAIYDPAFPADDGSAQTQIFQLGEGWQHLDGRTALHYARTRHQDDDYHRVQRQQAVLLAIRDKLLTPEVIPQWPTLLSRLSGLIRTDLTASELAQLACIAPQIDRSAIAGYAIDANMVIPWTTPTGGSVSIPNRAAIAPLIQLFLGP